jgi:hypothetical protein
MPENLVVTLRTEKQGGGFWPFLRGTFAWIGFGAVVACVWFLNAPDGDPQRVIEAARHGWQAYQTTLDNSKAPVANPYAGIVLDPRLAPEAERVCNPYDDHTNPKACALMGGDPPQ